MVYFTRTCTSFAHDSWRHDCTALHAAAKVIFLKTIPNPSAGICERSKLVTPWSRTNVRVQVQSLTIAMAMTQPNWILRFFDPSLFVSSILLATVKPRLQVGWPSVRACTGKQLSSSMYSTCVWTLIEGHARHVRCWPKLEVPYLWKLHCRTVKDKGFISIETLQTRMHCDMLNWRGDASAAAQRPSQWVPCIGTKLSLCPHPRCFSSPVSASCQSVQLNQAFGLACACTIQRWPLLALL